MSANQELKKKVVQEIKTKIQDSKSVVLVDYKGLTVGQVTELRNKFRDADTEYKVYKNRLLKIAFEELGIKFPETCYDGPTAVAFSKDVITPAKIVMEGETAYKVMKAKAGMFEGKIGGYDEVKAYALIPTREVLIAGLLGLLTNPIRSLAIALNETAKKMN